MRLHHLLLAIGNGNVRALGMSAPGGTGAVTSLPLIGSTVPGFEFTPWSALYAALGTPPATIEKVADAVRKTVTALALKATMEAQGVELTYASAQDLMQVMKRDTDKWPKIIRNAKIAAE